MVHIGTCETAGIDDGGQRREGIEGENEIERNGTKKRETILNHVWLNIRQEMA